MNAANRRSRFFKEIEFVIWSVQGILPSAKSHLGMSRALLSRLAPSSGTGHLRVCTSCEEAPFACYLALLHPPSPCHSLLCIGSHIAVSLLNDIGLVWMLAPIAGQSGSAAGGSFLASLPQHCFQAGAFSLQQRLGYEKQPTVPLALWLIFVSPTLPMSSIPSQSLALLPAEARV